MYTYTHDIVSQIYTHICSSVRVRSAAMLMYKWVYRSFARGSLSKIKWFLCVVCALHTEIYGQHTFSAYDERWPNVYTQHRSVCVYLKIFTKLLYILHIHPTNPKRARAMENVRSLICLLRYLGDTRRARVQSTHTHIRISCSQNAPMWPTVFASNNAPTVNLLMGRLMEKVCECDAAHSHVHTNSNLLAFKFKLNFPN